MPLEIVTLPCLRDNYAFLGHDVATGATLVVDVPEAVPVLRALQERGWRLSHILITHHHDDHIDGVAALAGATGARVIGAQADAHRLPPLDEAVAPGDIVRVGMAQATVLDAPGHTLGHIAYHFGDTGAVFTGDSLMAFGCGRLFEGTPQMMWDTLRQLSTLPPETLIYSGHEYTAANARFAATIEPDNPEIAARIDKITRARTEGQPTVPTVLAEELATNPFLRAHLPHIKTLVGMAGATDAAVFAEIRARKDRF